jgi:hypothetical protein
MVPLCLAQSVNIAGLRNPVLCKFVFYGHLTFRNVVQLECKVWSQIEGTTNFLPAINLHGNCLVRRRAKEADKLSVFYSRKFRGVLPRISSSSERTVVLRVTLGAYRATYYCPLQFTWRLHSTLMILSRLVTARFMQRDGKAGIHWWNNICAAVFSPLLQVQTAHTVSTTEKCYFEC